MQTFTRYEVIVTTKDNTDYYTNLHDLGSVVDCYVSETDILVITLADSTEIQYKKWDSFRATPIKEPRKAK